MKRFIIKAGKQIVSTVVSTAIKTGLVKESTDSIQNTRIGICNTCEKLTENRTCSICKCFIDIKTKLLNQQCPLNKW